jgi:hypothetical protein
MQNGEAEPLRARGDTAKFTYNMEAEALRERRETAQMYIQNGG